MPSWDPYQGSTLDQLGTLSSPQIPRLLTPPPTTNPASAPEYTTTNSYHTEIEYHYDQFVPYRNILHYDQFVPYRNRLHYDQFVPYRKILHYDQFIPYRNRLHYDQFVQYGSRYIATNSLRCEFFQLVTNIYQD